MFHKPALLWLLLTATTVHAAQNVVVVLDDSGSMNDRMRSDRRVTKIQAAKQALLTVLETLPADTRVGILLLNGGRGSDRWVYPLAPVDTARLRERIQRIGAHGGTPLGGRMKEGCDALLSLRAKEHYGSYRLLIVTDGEATDGDLAERYLPDILSRGIWVGAIGVDMDSNHSLATNVHAYRKAENPHGLMEAIRELIAESTGAPTDAGESDFQLIASIPDEVAAAALKALSESGNHRISEKPPLPPEARADVGPGEPLRPPGEQRGRGGQGYVGWVLGVICLVVVVFFLLAAYKKPKRL